MTFTYADVYKSAIRESQGDFGEGRQFARPRREPLQQTSSGYTLQFSTGSNPAGAVTNANSYLHTITQNHKGKRVEIVVNGRKATANKLDSMKLELVGRNQTPRLVIYDQPAKPGANKQKVAEIDLRKSGKIEFKTNGSKPAPEPNPVPNNNRALAQPTTNTGATSSTAIDRFRAYLTKFFMGKSIIIEITDPPSINGRLARVREIPITKLEGISETASRYSLQVRSSLPEEDAFVDLGTVGRTVTIREASPTAIAAIKTAAQAAKAAAAAEEAKKPVSISLEQINSDADLASVRSELMQKGLIGVPVTVKVFYKRLQPETKMITLDSSSDITYREQTDCLALYTDEGRHTFYKSDIYGDLYAVDKIEISAIT